MSSNFSKKKKAGVSGSTRFLIGLVVLLGVALGALAAYFYVLGDAELSVQLSDVSTAIREKFPAVRAAEAEPSESAPELAEPEAEEPKETEPPFTAAATGRTGDVLCCERYTAEFSAELAEKTVAVCAGAELTNAELQIWYLSEVGGYRASAAEPAPDFDRPLDEQRCPLTEQPMSWQHYFLERAVKNWQTVQALLLAAQQPQLIQEEAYKPNEFDDLHGKYVAEELPVHGFLYQDQDCYQPNEMHQAYLDGLEEQLAALTAAQGFKSVDEYAQVLYGTDAEQLLSAVKNYNTAYFYFTECSYDLEVSDEDAEKYWENHQAALGGDSQLVDVRQLLLIPQDAEVAPDGRVEADEEAWDACEKQAEKLLTTWRSDYHTTRNAESNFGRLTHDNSQDPGSSLCGGYYQGIGEGEMIGALNDWLFDANRKVGDVEIIRSELGYHLVYLCARYHNGIPAAREALVKEREQKLLQSCLNDARPGADYSAAAIWSRDSQRGIDLEALLYADVAHERFPSVMVYFQQDYMLHPYGASNVGLGGCGITTMAMLTTYMTDEIQTPAMMADMHSDFRETGGTNGDIFHYATADHGYYMERNAYNIDDVVEALKNGQMVISLQVKGVFTSGGHFLLLQRYNEWNDTIQVRDSNIYNYGKLNGHKVDYFTKADILSGNSVFYIMEPKIRRIPSCVRCGSQMEEHSPELLLNADYICPKCTKAVSRRSNFVELAHTI